MHGPGDRCVSSLDESSLVRFERRPQNNWLCNCLALGLLDVNAISSIQHQHQTDVTFIATNSTFIRAIFFRHKMEYIYIKSIYMFHFLIPENLTTLNSSVRSSLHEYWRKWNWKKKKKTQNCPFRFNTVSNPADLPTTKIIIEPKMNECIQPKIIHELKWKKKSRIGNIPVVGLNNWFNDSAKKKKWNGCRIKGKHLPCISLSFPLPSCNLQNSFSSSWSLFTQFLCD